MKLAFALVGIAVLAVIIFAGTDALLRLFTRLRDKKSVENRDENRKTRKERRNVK
jgi:hypothetical protein